MNSETRTYRTGGDEVVLDLTRTRPTSWRTAATACCTSSCPTPPRARDHRDGCGIRRRPARRAGRPAAGRRPVAAPPRLARPRPLARDAGDRAAALHGAGARRPARAGHLAEHLPGGPQRGQRPAARCAGPSSRGERTGPAGASRRASATPPPGDELVRADVVMDRGFDLPAPPEEVWPWLVQLGKRRAGWYLAEVGGATRARRRCRALRRIERRWLAPRGRRRHRGLGWRRRDVHARGDRGRPATLLYTSRRGSTDLTWCLHLSPTGDRRLPRPACGCGSGPGAADRRLGRRHGGWPGRRAARSSGWRPGARARSVVGRSGPATDAGEAHRTGVR